MARMIKEQEQETRTKERTNHEICMNLIGHKTDGCGTHIVLPGRCGTRCGEEDRYDPYVVWYQQQQQDYDRCGDDGLTQQQEQEQQEQEQ